MGHTYSNNLYHILFSTKGRRKLLADENREEELKAFLEKHGIDYDPDHYLD